MAFESLLGNERIKQNLTAAAQKNRFAHFYLISGPKAAASIPWQGFWLPPSCVKMTAAPAASAPPVGK